MHTDPDIAIIKKYRCWLPKERAVEARKAGMPQEFVDVATAGIELNVGRKSSEKDINDEATWAEFARADMTTHMGRFLGVSSPEISSDWFEVEFLRDV